MAHERLKPAYTFDEDRLKQLQQIAPEAFADGKVNWETLKESLGEYLEDEESEEHFGLFWPGKREARRLASIPSTGTLVPVYGEGLTADGTPDDDGKNDSRNIFIEGENLEVLKILQKSYAGKIKMIYIDPPYNTGNDFVYDDNFTEPLQEYLRRTEQVDEEGIALTTNKRSDGRFHSNWLSMMYPRLRLARNLLKSNGVIFVSIDDNESHNLKILMDEIFGPENFVASIVWQKKYSPQNDATYFSNMHDYILCYAKLKKNSKNDENGWDLNLLPRTEEQNARYKNPDNDPRGPWKASDFSVKTYSEEYDYPITTPSGRVISPPRGRCWMTSKENYKKLVSDNRIWFGETGQNVPALKKFLSEVQQGTVPSTIWFRDEVGDNQEAKNEIKELFEYPPFDTPKPTRLIDRIIHLGSDKQENNEIILDFFAGSATTGHAVYLNNIEKENNNRYILVQLPEEFNSKNKNNKWENLTEVSRERLKQASYSIKKKKPKYFLDLGFQVFKLTKSHYNSWQNYSGQDVSQLETLFSQFEDPLVQGWTKEGLLSELMLLEGFPLDSQIEERSEYSANKIHKVSSDFHEHSLLVCLDDKIQATTIQQLDLKGNDIFICLDKAINDQDKLRLSDKGVIKTI